MNHSGIMDMVPAEVRQPVDSKWDLSKQICV